MKLLFILLTLSSCAWNSVQENFAQKEGGRFQQEFLQVASRKGIRLTPVKISFIDLKEKFKSTEHIAGMCHEGEVFIDRYWWRQNTVWAKEQVVFHELGHCLLNLPHLKGLMNTKEIPSSIYLKYKQDLLEQMFTQKMRQKK